MKKMVLSFIILLVSVVSLTGCQEEREKNATEIPMAEQSQVAEPKAESGYEQDGKGCEPAFSALFDQAVVELSGTGSGDIVVVTDPLCWHCRLAHKLLGEYPEKYGRLRLSFFPRRGFIGSDMAAWILEDVVGTERLRAYVDYAYTDLKQPSTHDLTEARMVVLAQFAERFPELLDCGPLEEIFVRMQREHEPHVAESVSLGRAAGLPGTPVLVAGSSVLIGFGPAPWLEALDAATVCP